MNRLLWALIAVLGLLLLAEQCGDSGLRDAAADAQARADSIASARADAEDALAELAGKHAAIADELNRARDSLGIVRSEARRAQAEARETATVAAREVRAALDSVGASTAWLDALEAAHRAEMQAKAEELEAVASENAYLWLRVAAADSLISMQERVNLDLRREIQALRVSVDLYQNSGTSFLGRLGHDLKVAAIGAAIGAVGWELAR